MKKTLAMVIITSALVSLIVNRAMHDSEKETDEVIENLVSHLEKIQWT